MFGKINITYDRFICNRKIENMFDEICENKSVRLKIYENITKQHAFY